MGAVAATTTTRFAGDRRQKLAGQLWQAIAPDRSQQQEAGDRY